MNLNYIRPSTIARIVEDSVLGTARGAVKLTAFVASTAMDNTRGIVHAISTEYQARRLIEFQQDIEEQAARFAKMTPRQRAKLQAAQREVMDRVAELEEAQAVKRARRAAQAK